jgi:transglutaminase-like putative cysteine protease
MRFLQFDFHFYVSEPFLGLTENWFLLYTQTMTNTKQRWWDLFAAVCLVSAIWVSAIRLEAAHWTDELQRVEPLLFLAFILGVLIGQSRFKGTFVFFMGGVHTLAAIFWQLGLTMAPQTPWLERSASIIGRLGVTFFQFLKNQPVYDAILFQCSMYLLFWIMGLIGGYKLTRDGRPWFILLLAGISLLIFDYYPPAIEFKDRYTAGFVFLSLLLAARVYYLEQRKNWLSKGVRIDGDLGFNLGTGVFVTGLVLVLLAWNAGTIVQAFNPSAPPEEVKAWTTIRERMSKAFAALQAPKPVFVQTYMNELGLGNGAVLGDEIIFTAKVKAVDPAIRRFYWRGFSYDSYKTQGGWTNTIKDSLEITPQDNLETQTSQAGYKSAQIAISNRQAFAQTIFTGTQPLSFSRPVKVIGVKQAAFSDTVTVQFDPLVRAGEVYQVTTYFSAPTMSELRKSGQNYPAWVKEHYLQLPQDFSARVKDLAKKLTANQKTTYDKVQAVTDYLRENIEYQPVIPIPPKDRDVLEWFLFDQKQGFCNYYASAEVLMLRSVGIPSRLVVGYAEGTLDDIKNEYIVMQKDSHAWPEVYFEGIGWVEFEPTSAQPAVQIAAGESTDNNPSNLGGNQSNPSGEQDELEGPLTRRSGSRKNEIEDVDLGENSTPLTRFWPWLPYVVTLVIVAVLVLAYFILRRRFKILRQPVPVALETVYKWRGWKTPNLVKEWSVYAQLSPIEKAFLTVRRSLRLMGEKPLASQTPSELVSLFDEKLPEASDAAHVLLNSYHQSVYSPEPVTEISRVHQAERTIWKILFLNFVNRVFGL